MTDHRFDALIRQSAGVRQAVAAMAVARAHRYGSAVTAAGVAGGVRVAGERAEALVEACARGCDCEVCGEPTFFPHVLCPDCLEAPRREAVDAIEDLKRAWRVVGG